MLGALVFALISLRPIFHRPSAAALLLLPDHGNASWFMGCVDASSSLYATGGARDLDPVTCSVRCLGEGYQVAALTSEACYCGNQQHGLVASECFNTSSNGGTKDVRGERQSVLYLPVGGEQGSVALYRTEGPFLHSVRLSTSPERVHAGKTFVMEVSGNLAGRPDQPTGILGLGEQDLSYVTVEFQETTPKGQSSHHVNVQDDGSFVVSSDWILKTPGKYELNVSVSNRLSTVSSTLHLSVLQPSTDGLLVSVLHGPLGVPSCIPLPQKDSHSGTVEAAYLGDPVTLQAHMGNGLAVEFFWWTTHEKKEKNMERVETVCLPNSDRLISTVNWTFDTEGVHMVSVNASSAYGWTQETIHIVVVPLAVSDLRGSESWNQLTSIRALRSSGSCKSAISTHAEFNLEVVGPASRKGSGVIWTFSLDNIADISRRTEECNVNVSLTIAGRYKVSAKAFNPISWASFCTHILLQDPVGELLLNVPSMLTTNQKHPVSFSVTAGSNVTVSLLANVTLLYRNSSYATGEEAMVVLLFDHTGTVVVELQAENRVSSQNKRENVC